MIQLTRTDTRSRLVRFALLMMSLVAFTFATPVIASAMTAASTAPNPGQPNLGPNVIIFDTSMSTAAIQAQVDSIAAQQVDNQFGSQRYALLFKPGTYGSADQPLIFQVGYYTEVAGLGASPTDVTINGHIDVYNQCLAPDNCIALVNFWRSLSNLTINVMGLDGCRSSGDFWAVSQAAPMRRVNVNGTLTLMDYCTAGPQYASGGFIADSQLGTVVNGSQQQFLVRNSSLGSWSNGVWNQVFSGVENAPATSFPSPPYTTLDTSPVTRERPFLTVGASGKLSVFVPALRRNSSGTSWGSGPAKGASIPIKDFYIAYPGDKVSKINAALARGQNLLFTPGVYNLDQTIRVKRADTLVLGLGFATLMPKNGIVAMTVDDVRGVKIAGLLFDAGSKKSPVLLRIGSDRKRHHADGSDSKHRGDANDPTVLFDVFFRIGGAAAGKADVTLVVNSDNVILDHIWAWRADHGSGVGWDVNTANTGVIVNGDNVTAYGLFVEHYQKYEVIWNGERGRTIMFQNEMPYDPPNQAAWMNGPLFGYAAYKVADFVDKHEAWGLGSYCVFTTDASIHSSRGFEVPDKPGVKLHSILTVSLGGVGTIDHVVNNTGDAANTANQVSNLVSYP